jgi:hypothetical protein
MASQRQRAESAVRTILNTASSATLENDQRSVPGKCSDPLDNLPDEATS